jgi:hypothetical protein
MRLCLLFFVSLALLSPGSSFAIEPGAWTLSVDWHGRRLEGFPLRFSDTEVSLLLRDGQMVELAPTEVTNFKKASSTFRPFSAGEMRAELLRELAPTLEVTGTGHYLVAHPKGKGSQWAERFEELYRSMMHYFAVRGFKMREPEFPLVAIVWGKREDFLRYAAAEGINLPPGVIGYYSPMTNRVTLYDMAAGNKDPEAWRQNAATVVHEATHQTAFNTGVHRRFAFTPTWVVEGLGTLFEPRGVWDSRRYPRREDRLNRDRLDNFRQYLKAGRPPQGFLLLVADDRLFRTNPLAAYAEAWALTFYLVEQEPRKYGEYLAKTAALEPFAPYGTERRLADFKAVFGGDPRMLEANYLRFIEGLK